MVFAPRFEIVEEALEDGCFLTSDVGPGDTTWSVDERRKLTGGRYFIGDAHDEERVLLRGRRRDQHPRPAWVRVLDAWLLASGHAPEEAPARLRLPVRRGVGRDHLEHRGHRRRAASRWAATRPHRGVRHAVQVHRLLGGLQIRCGGWPSQWWSKGHAKRTAPTIADVRAVTIRYSATEEHDLYLGTFLYTDCGKVGVTVDGVAPAESPIDLYLNEYGGTTANVKIASAVPGRKPHRRPHRPVRTQRRQHRVLLLLRLPVAARAAGRSGPAEGVSGRVAGHRLRHRPRVQEASGLAPLASPEARVQGPRRRVHGRLLEQQAAARGRDLSVRDHRVCARGTAAPQAGEVVSIRCPERR